jgi:uncharacterized membrane protein YphA (DoxX/SURF4 family)
MKIPCLIPKNKDLGSFLLRFFIGALFLYGGLGKIIGSAIGGPGIAGFSGMVWGSLAIAWLVALVEIFAGLFLIIGFATRHSSLFLIVILLFAIGMVHNPIVNSNELMNFFVRLALIGGLAQIVFSGSGKIAISED